MKIFKVVLDPVFDKKEKIKAPERNDRPQNREKPIAGEYIDYEEIR